MVNSKKNQDIDLDHEIERSKKRGKLNNENIDDIDNDDADNLDKNKHIAENNIIGERGAFSYGSKSKQLPVGAKSFLFLILTCAIILGLSISWKAWQVHNEQKNAKANNVIRNTLPPLKLLPLQTEDNDNLQQYTHNPEENNVGTEEHILEQETDKTEISYAEALQRRRLSPDLTGNNNSNANQSSPGNNGQNNFNDNAFNDTANNERSKNEFQNKLEPLQLNPSAAGIIGNANYLLTQGSMIDCQLETRMITTQDGMTSCYTTRNIYSTNGRVILIDRGSKIVGHYQGGMQQGQARIFVLWTRIETPKGVIVNLDSPGSGPLGEGGVGGSIDTHFWQRFGGAIMISLIGDFGQYLANQGQKGKNNNTIQFSNTREGVQQAATEALKNSINTPPTLYKNQGERISIFVARDLDFGRVYGLKIQQ